MTSHSGIVSDSSDDITPPIIVDENGDLSFYRSIEAAARHMEAVDVSNDEYDVFDAKGRILAAHIIEGAVRILPEDPPDYQPEALANRLRRYVQRVGQQRIAIPGEIATLTLPDLVHAIWRFQQH